MIKYYCKEILFQEIPNEISLGISISGCPNHCPQCHSKFLWDDVGIDLTYSELYNLINDNAGITCVCFLGGDQDQEYIRDLCKYIKERFGLKVAWYSGKQVLNESLNILEYLDFLKLGPFKEECGPLTSKNSNQKFYKVVNGNLILQNSLFYSNVS